jgi:hypothetical protein
VFPVRYELGFYIPEDGILHSTAVKTSNLPKSIFNSLLHTKFNHVLSYGCRRKAVTITGHGGP